MACDTTVMPVIVTSFFRESKTVKSSTIWQCETEMTHTLIPILRIATEFLKMLSFKRNYRIMIK